MFSLFLEFYLENVCLSTDLHVCSFDYTPNHSLTLSLLSKYSVTLFDMLEWI